jgi:hypothetical protein
MKPRKRLGYIQSFEVSFTGRQIESGKGTATDAFPFPWTHPEKSFYYRAIRINLPIQTVKTIDQFLWGHAFWLK